MECTHERVAQSVEHVTFNHGVVGSIPTALTNKINGLDDSFTAIIKPNCYPGNALGNNPWTLRPFIGT